MKTQERSKNEIETILNETRWDSQSTANTHLQKFGYRAQINDNGTAQIFEAEGNKSVASLKFENKSTPSIQSITY